MILKPCRHKFFGCECTSDYFFGESYSIARKIVPFGRAIRDAEKRGEEINQSEKQECVRTLKRIKKVVGEMLDKRRRCDCESLH